MQNHFIKKLFLTGFVTLSLVNVGCRENIGPDEGEHGGKYLQTDLVAPEQLTVTVESGVPGVPNSNMNFRFLHLEWKNPEVIVDGASIVVEYKLQSESSFHVDATISGALTSYDLDLGLLTNDTTYVVRVKAVLGSKETDYSNEVNATATAPHQYNVPTITSVASIQGDPKVYNTWNNTNYSEIQTIECQNKPDAHAVWVTYTAGSNISNMNQVCITQQSMGMGGVGYYVYRIKVTYTDGTVLYSNISQRLVCTFPAPTNLFVQDQGGLNYSWVYGVNWGTELTGFYIESDVYTGTTFHHRTPYTINDPTQRTYHANPCTGVVNGNVKSRIRAKGDAAGNINAPFGPDVTSYCP